jgi:hypothetical protein
VRQLLEISFLQLTRGIGYDIYHYAGMWDRTADWDYKTGFLGYKDFAREVYRLNERKFQGMSQFKPYEKAFFNLFGIPTAPFVGLLHPQSGIDAHGQPLRNAEQLRGCIKEFVGSRFCAKPTQGFNGWGFKAFELVERGGEPLARKLFGGEEYDSDALFSVLNEEYPDGWLLEGYLEQHPMLKEFNPTSLNTIRMFVYQDNNGKVALLGAFLKTGRAGALIDKTENGGASVFVDLETGELLSGFNWAPDMRPLERHPATGKAFAGVPIPYWPEAIKMACFALQVSVGTRFVGIDMAITENGPAIVEMNVHPDADCMPVLRLQTRKIFSE